VAVFDALNDPDFVQRAVSGDPEAFRQLFDALVGPVAVFIERMGLSAADAEEIAADTLIKVHRSLHAYSADGRAKLTTWIFEIVRNAATDRRRSFARQATQDQEFRLDYVSNGLQSLNLPDRREGTARVIDAALKALRHADQDILRMRQVMEYSEIARAENATEQAVRVRYKRALDRLKEEVAKRGVHG
jgi:RNA polymerase sigma-70 factor (ECF subfamily)